MAATVCDELGELTKKQRTVRRSRSSKVTDFATNRKPVCYSLFVNDTNLHPILHGFRIMVDY